jgi:hypothetical protein
VRYFATASGPAVRDAMRAGLLGQIITPASGNALLSDVDWCADNAVYANRYPGDERYLAWLAAHTWAAARCAFAVAPDVVADAAATLERSAPMLPRIRALGLPVALAAQNGLEPLTVPWDRLDVIFVGGDTRWKLGPAARSLVTEARHRGKGVHLGRVNSERRLHYAAAIGCDSADGTYLAYGPDRNLPRLLWWLRPALFDAASEFVPDSVLASERPPARGAAFPQMDTVGSTWPTEPPPRPPDPPKERPHAQR